MLHSLYPPILNWSAKDIILGMYDQTNYAVNNCILLGKNVIHKSKCNTKPVRFDAFLRTLRRSICSEKHILYKNNKQNVFTNRWGVFNVYFGEI